MEQTKITDRIVVEIMAQDDTKLSAETLACQLRQIADNIESGIIGGSYTDKVRTDSNSRESEAEFEVLWEYECQQYGALRMGGNESLVHNNYYDNPA